MTVANDRAAAALLDFDVVAERVFRARYNQDNHAGIIFGGQPMAQCLAAAWRTVPAAWAAHSFSGYFLRGGMIDRPVDYAVEIVRDGRRFAARRVLASQDGRPIYDALCSFNDPEDGCAHQQGDIAGVPPPEALVDLRDFLAAHADRVPAQIVALHRRPFPIDLRLADPAAAFLGGAAVPHRDYWVRIPGAASLAGAADHACLLAFLSDYWLAGTPGAMHQQAARGRGPISVVTLNHSMWLHGTARVDDWLLYRTDSPWTGQGRGLARGQIYDRTGRLVASTAQEVSIRIG